MKKLFVGLLFLVLAFHNAGAVTPDERLADPALEERARQISQNLRCLVCQNQSIDDSDADLAHDLRIIVRKKVQSGATDEQIKSYLVERYGDYILLNPPLKSSTYILWATPPLLVCFGLIATFVYFRRNVNGQAASPLTNEESRRLAALLSHNKHHGAS